MVNKIRWARMQEGKLQIEVAKKAGIHVSILSQLENGWRNPTPRQLKKLKRVLPKLAEAERLMRKETRSRKTP